MRVLVRAPNWIGDAVMAEPALKELRRIFKSEHLTLATSAPTARLFEGEGLADELLELGVTTGIVQTPRAFLSDLREFRKRRVDLAILLQNAFSAALLAKSGRVRRVFGYPTDGRSLLLTDRLEFERDYRSVHQVRYYLNAVRQVEERLAGESSISVTDVQPRLTANEESRSAARALLAVTNLSPASRIIALNPGATNSRAKRWLPERFAEAADQLADRYGFETMIVGSGGDVPIANRVAGLMRSRAAVLAGKTSASDLKGLLSLASVMISNDTGGAHVSAALGVPTVIVFGPTEHVSTKPLANLAEVVRQPVECSPCMLRDCPIDHRCMTRVESVNVVQVVEHLLAKVTPT